MFRIAAISLVAAMGMATAVRADDPAPLSGPKVQDTGLPGESKSFGPSGAKLKGEVRAIDDRVLHQAIGSLRGPAVEESLRLTDAQDRTIREATEKAAAARRAFYQEHEAEIKSVMSDLGVDAKDIKGDGGIRAAFERARTVRDGTKKVKKDAQGQNPEGQMTDEATQKRDAARQKLMDIRSRMPKMDEAHAQIWAALTQPQKDVVQAKIKELSDEQSARKQLPAATKKVERKLKNKNSETPANELPKKKKK